MCSQTSKSVSQPSELGQAVAAGPSLFWRVRWDDALGRGKLPSWRVSGSKNSSRRGPLARC